MKTNFACWLLVVSCLVGCGVPAAPVESIAASDAAPRDATPVLAAAGDWPWWRGPDGDGIARDVQPAATWSQEENVVWRTPLAGRGHSSPVIVGERIFLTTADEEAERQSMLAFDRTSGEPLWTTVIHEGGLMGMHQKNSHASATAACDGERLYAVFINGGALHVTAVDLDGEIVWRREAGPFTSEHGYGSSPVIHQSLVIVNGDNMSGSFLAALDRQTGEIVWRVNRKTTGQHGSYATPIVAELAGRPQLLLMGIHNVSSYDPATGELIWTCDGPAEVTAATVAYSDTTVFASGGYPEKEILGVRADGAGDVSDSHVAWRAGENVAYVPSPLFHDGALYVVADGGVISRFDAATGEQIWKGRLEGNFSASPVLAGDLIYISNEAGKTFVVRAAPEFEIVAENDLGERCLATLTILGDRIYLRTDDHLYCIGDASNVDESRTSRNRGADARR